MKNQKRIDLRVCHFLSRSILRKKWPSLAALPGSPDNEGDQLKGGIMARFFSSFLVVALPFLLGCKELNSGGFAIQPLPENEVQDSASPTEEPEAPTPETPSAPPEGEESEMPEVPEVPRDATRYYDQREVIVRTMRNFEEPSNVKRVLDLVKKYNFTTISISVKQDEDDPDESISGTVFYKSNIAPVASRYKNWDVLADVIREAKARGIRVQAWMPQFHDQVAAQKKPDWAMKALINGQVVTYQGSNPEWPEHFANPLNPEVQAYQLSLIKEFLSKYEVDSLLVDWLRFDDYHMDMSDATRADFQNLYGYDPTTINFKTDNSKRRSWNSYRSSKLADYARRVKETVNSVRPGLPVGSYILPPEFEECGQDSAKLGAYLDFFSPMAYYHDWQKPLSWVYDTLIDMTVTKVGVQKVRPIYDIIPDTTQSDYDKINVNVSSRFGDIRAAGFFKYTWWDEADFQKADNATKK